MEKTKKMLPYLIIIILDFYLLPLLIKDTGTAMMMMLIVIPLICFVCSGVYGIRNSFNLFYALIVAILFVPSIFIFYNSTAWVYVLEYGIVALAGNAIGMMFYKQPKWHLRCAYAVSFLLAVFDNQVNWRTKFHIEFYRGGIYYFN